MACSLADILALEFGQLGQHNCGQFLRVVA
jgi:hypothetical protein